jgi:hypothetical protein
MYSLFKLLFRSTYWRMLLRKDTWKEAGVSIRRVHKDRRARKHVLSVFLMLLIPFICLVYAAWFVGTGALFLVPVLIPVVWWRGWREKRDSVPLNIVPKPEPIEKVLSDEEARSLRQYFAELAIFYAVMIDRAGSESFLKTKILPEGFEVISRRLHLDLLKAQNLWERMARADREAMMMADGHWERERVNQVSLALELLRLLRWMLRLDFYLPVVGQQLRNDYGIANEIAKTPQKVMDGTALIDISTMRIGRDATKNYFLRCIAEGISRGYYEASNDDAAVWAKEVSEGLQGKQHDDLVLGAKLVSETTEEDLRWAVSLSQRRWDFLSWAMRIMEEGKTPEWKMSVFPEITEERLVQTD